MILLDTHIWIWWVNGSSQLTTEQTELLQEHESQGFGVSVISCWEVAKLVERQRLALAYPIDVWLNEALKYPGICLLPLTPRIAVESTLLPSEFHRDPADQIIVATSRIYNCPLLTADQKILNYSGVTTL